MSRKKFWLFPLRKPDRKCSFVAIFVDCLGFLLNEGGDVKPCISIVILCLLYSLRYQMKAHTMDIILVYCLLKSVHSKLSYDQ